MARESQTTARLEARLPVNMHALLMRAAEIECRTLTDFLVSAAREWARRSIEDMEILRLAFLDQRQIAEALLNRPERPQLWIKPFSANCWARDDISVSSGAARRAA